MTFKIGDKVRVRDVAFSAPGEGGIDESFRGHVGEVVGIYSGPWLKWPTVTYRGGAHDPSYGTNMHPDCLERVEISRGEALAEERGKEYGHPKVSFSRIAHLWGTYLTGTNGQMVHVEADDVAMLMILLKVSRSITDDKPDTIDDIDGYTACLRALRE